MEHSQNFPDGSQLFATGYEEYMEYIQNDAPDGSMIFVGDPIPEQTYRCQGCGSEMSKTLTSYHSCGRMAE